VEWFRRCRQNGQPLTSPSTGLALSSAFLLPVEALKKAIEAYLAHRPELKQRQQARRSFEEAARWLQDELLVKQTQHASLAEELSLLRARVEQLEGVEAANQALRFELQELRCETQAARRSDNASTARATTHSEMPAMMPPDEAVGSAAVAEARPLGRTSLNFASSSSDDAEIHHGAHRRVAGMGPAGQQVPVEEQLVGSRTRLHVPIPVRSCLGRANLGCLGRGTPARVQGESLHGNTMEAALVGSMTMQLPRVSLPPYKMK